jgi:hypothetical protein
VLDEAGRLIRSPAAHPKHPHLEHHHILDRQIPRSSHFMSILPASELDGAASKLFD